MREDREEGDSEEEEEGVDEKSDEGKVVEADAEEVEEERERAKGGGTSVGTVTSEETGRVPSIEGTVGLCKMVTFSCSLMANTLVSGDKRYSRSL